MRIQQQRNLVEEYEINPFTMVIMPTTYGSKTYSRVYETEDNCLSPFKPIEIIKKSCQFFGSSYEGRKDGVRELTGITHKVPIPVSPTNFIYFFPTTSPDNSECIWLAHEHIVDYKKGDKCETSVLFTNKEVMHIPISYNSFHNQISRTLLVRSKLGRRLEDTRTMYVNFGKKMRASENQLDYGNFGR